MSSTFMVLFLTLDYYNQPPTKSAIFSNKSVHGKKKAAQNTPLEFGRIIIHFGPWSGKSMSLLNMCLMISFWGQWKTDHVWFLKMWPLLFVVQFVMWELNAKKNTSKRNFCPAYRLAFWCSEASSQCSLPGNSKELELLPVPIIKNRYSLRRCLLSFWTWFTLAVTNSERPTY